MQLNENMIFFDGYCPESSLRGKKVDMRLNEDDFWKSVETGLQITSFPPFAAILRWRGKGKFKLHEQLASQHHKGLLLTETRWERDQEIHPNQEALLDNQFDLEYYIHQVYDTYELYEADRFNPVDEVPKTPGGLFTGDRHRRVDVSSCTL